MTHVDEGTDGLRSGVAEDRIQHRPGKPVDDGLALMSVGGGQNVTNLPQKLGHSTLLTSKI